MNEEMLISNTPDRQEDGGKKEVNEEMLISNTPGPAGGWREERSD